MGMFLVCEICNNEKCLGYLAGCTWILRDRQRARYGHKDEHLTSLAFTAFTTTAGKCIVSFGVSMDDYKENNPVTFPSYPLLRMDTAEAQNRRPG